MAEILRRALNWGRPAGPQQENAAEIGPPLLLLGGPGSGKTALLLAAALEVAGEDRGSVLFLTRVPLQSLPRGTRAGLDPLRLQKIRFQYPSSTRELLRLLCSAHETPGPAPSLLLLDGLEKYLMEDLGTQGTAHLAALLLDTAAHFSHRVGPGRGCGLIVTLQTQEEGNSGDTLQLLLLQRYFPAQCWLQLEAPGPGPHRLRICLEPRELGPRAEWWMSFQQDGEMTITSCATQTGNPSSDKSSSSEGQS
ncbi:PREDICTED: ATPase SWSAP1 [Condylura cristata]|uniref:ATPase SWSAP1 n=1 Tax=Condylura cristata TaxID=143302 RepID=UPI000334488B|nr:PREDICTED: ATPase SWSAP1 [Condylura cristata]